VEGRYMGVSWWTCG